MDAGIVDFYNAERGFGYIRPTGGDADVRVEFEALRVAGIRMLEQGQSVQYSTTENAVTGKVTVTALMLS
jgi:cold shock protein